jgi:hypothetical protein
MATQVKVPIYQGLVEYLANLATPEQVIAFTIDHSIEERGEELLDKNNDGELSPDERAELEELRQFHRVVSKLKAQAMLAVKSA